VRIVIITQDEPFYLAESLKYLIEIMPRHSQIVGCVVNDVSPFGKKENFIQKAKKTYDIFGLRFFMHYSSKYIKSKFQSSKKISNILNDFCIDKIVLNKHINHPESVQSIKKYDPDLLISILGNQIFKDPIIRLAPKGCLNLHTALLPKYRGLMPTFWVMKNDEEYTGVSVFFVDKGIDSGPIVVQEKVKIGNKSQEELIKHTKKIGMESIAKAVDLIEKDQVNLIENNDTEKSYYSFPEQKDVIDFVSKGKRFF
jgi:methionyl-tRNA formyltransferase